MCLLTCIVAGVTSTTTAASTTIAAKTTSLGSWCRLNGYGIVLLRRSSLLNDLLDRSLNLSVAVGFIP